MPLSTKHRSSLYRSLTPVVGAEEADALLNELPALEGDELMTKQFLRAELAELRGDLGGQIAAVRAELHERLAGQTRWVFAAIIGGLTVQTAVFSVIVSLLR